MILPLASRRRTALKRLLGGLACLMFCAAGFAAQAESHLTARYTISMTGVPIGRILWTVDVGDGFYTTSASGMASGALSILVNGEGRVSTHGVAKGGRLMPTFFTSNVNDDDGNIGLQMIFNNGAISELLTNAPPPKPDHLPVTEADRHGATDPLTAMLISAASAEDALMPASCNRVLAIFDGQRRYNLALSYKRVDTMKADEGYAGPVLVCGVVLQPIAGYKADSVLVKYVAGRRDMELWFAPLTGTAIIAPIRVLMPTLLGTLEIAADRFATTTPATVPVPAPPDELKR